MTPVKVLIYYSLNPLYQFSIVVIKYHQFSGLKQYKCITYISVGWKSNMGLTEAKIQVSEELCSFPEALGENPFPFFSSF